jgi:hypothetical protein
MNPTPHTPTPKPDKDHAAVLNDDTKTTKEHQDDLLDEGVEETFPASDPVSVKRIT